MSENLVREMLRAKAKAAKNPAFYEGQSELAYKLKWAEQMKEAGRLTKAEFKEFEAHCTHEYLEALPVEAFIEMQKDGSYADLEAIARSHDGKRHGTDVLKDRASLNKKITADALDEAFAAQKIDSKRYSVEHRNLGTFDDERVRRINDADDANDGDAVALDIFFERNIAPEPEQEPGTAPRLPESITSPPAPADDNRIKDASED